MKHQERERARQLRCDGLSLEEIRAQVPVAKSTLSLWLRDIELAPEQIERLCERTNHRAAGLETFRQVMRAQREARWAQFHAEAAREWETLRHDPDFMFGLALYIGEGAKAGSECVALSNCDPRVITKGMEFFGRIGVPRDKIRVTINLHPGLCETTAIKFWQKATGLPHSQFHKIVRAVSRASQGKKGNIQPYGTCRIMAYSTHIRQKLEVWMRLALESPAPDQPCDKAGESL